VKASALKAIMYSPQWTSRLLHYFISGAMAVNDKGIKFELIFFALPLVLDNKIAKKLSNSKKTSTLTTVFKEVDLKERLIGINERIENYREITNQGLIYLGNTEKLNIGEYINISECINYQKENDLFLKQKYKAAYNWGCILGKQNYQSVFLRMGVTTI